MPNAQNVSAAKPKIDGAIYAAPVGTTLPTDTDAALDAAFLPMGYVSEDGVTNTTNIESQKIKAWGGDTVLISQTSKDDGFKFKLIEALNVNVLKFVYGSKNVSGDLTTGIAIAVSSEEVEEVALVVDTVLRGGVKKRSCVPACKLSALEDIIYNDNDPIGYDTTMECTPDIYGNTHYEYIKKSQVSG